jgi:ABC-type glutathione transport system ATPase component
VLAVRDVVKVFQEGSQRVEVLHGVSLDVRAGEVVALAGPSGSGKTTLLSIMGCILTPSSGRVAELDSEELRAALAEDRARVTEAEAEVRLAESTLKRRADLAAERIVAAHDLDQAQRDLDIARARRLTARAAVERDEARLRKTRILAPISGTVIGRHAQNGETLEAGQRVFTLADLTWLRIEAEAGATVELKIDAPRER